MEVDVQNALSESTRVRWVCCEAKNSAIIATVKRLGLISR